MTWNPLFPAELQDASWTCSAASLSWCLQAGGQPRSELDVVVGLGPARISPAYGLLDASGAGLVSYLAEIGIASDNNPDATWQDVLDAAGHQPMLIGGRAWNHWTGVRLYLAATATTEDQVKLANPAPGWMGIHNVLFFEDFARLGPFSAVWLLL